MGCGSSSSPTSAEAPTSDPSHAPAVIPISLIAAAGRIMSAAPARPVSVPLLQPAAYKHPTPLTMVGQKSSSFEIVASSIDTFWINDMSESSENECHTTDIESKNNNRLFFSAHGEFNMIDHDMI